MCGLGLDLDVLCRNPSRFHRFDGAAVDSQVVRRDINLSRCPSRLRLLSTLLRNEAAAQGSSAIPLSVPVWTRQAGPEDARAVSVRKLRPSMRIDDRDRDREGHSSLDCRCDDVSQRISPVVVLVWLPPLLGNSGQDPST